MHPDAVQWPLLLFILPYSTGRILYGKENKEWNMEKFRYYIELPGDIWEDGYFMDLIKCSLPLLA